MSVILDISTTVPEHSLAKEELVKFYTHALEASGMPVITKKLSFLTEKVKISNRYSCIPDYKGNTYKLFTEDNYFPSVEKRMQVYKDNILPLAVKTTNEILLKNNIKPDDITHLITVSCTGLFAPGLEFLIADYYNMQNAEKIALNFLGCYAAIKAIKHANYIALAHPEACILIVCAELCSLHFMPSVTDEDIVANLIFSDGASSVLVCGNSSHHIKNKLVLNIDTVGSSCIPCSADLMTWDISSSAFRMYLSKYLVNAIKENIEQVVSEFLMDRESETDYWAIHPGGVRIVEAVKESLQLSESKVQDSMDILRLYGNMSSPTILFILHRIMQKIRNGEQVGNKSIFACAFGPGITVEMINLTSIEIGFGKNSNKTIQNYAVTV